MAESEDLPEDIIVNILTWLPVKSLIRFTSVSKRLHSIILSDPKFAQSQFKAARQRKTISRRLLFSTNARQLESGHEFESLHLDHTSSFGDPSSVVRTLSHPFPPPPSPRFCHVCLLGSCNGLVFIAFHEKLFYVWNPFIGFFKQLPDPGFSLHGSYYPLMPGKFYGVGYLSATDDYKVLVACSSYDHGFHETEKEVQMFSVRTHLWERIESLSDFELLRQGTFSNNALHWLNYLDGDEMVSFDLAEEVLRRMPLPNFDHDDKSLSYLGVCGGCLCLSRVPVGACDSMDLWVMKEYDVCDSWSMLFSLKLSHPPEFYSCSTEFLVMETAQAIQLIWIELERYRIKGSRISMIEYEESLLWISGCHPVEKKEQVQILETHQKASGSLIRFQFWLLLGALALIAFFPLAIFNSVQEQKQKSYPKRL
ncbi:F-box protein CPR1 [Rosa sericea]